MFSISLTTPKVNYLLKPSREQADCIKNKELHALKNKFGLLLERSEYNEMNKNSHS